VAVVLDDQDDHLPNLRRYPDFLCREFCTIAAIELLGRRQSVLDGELHERGNIGYAEFLHEPASVGIDGLRREIHEFRDPRAGVAFNHELKDLTFSRAETIQWSGFVGSASRARIFTPPRAALRPSPSYRRRERPPLEACRRSRGRAHACS